MCTLVDSYCGAIPTALVVYCSLLLKQLLTKEFWAEFSPTSENYLGDHEINKFSGKGSKKEIIASLAKKQIFFFLNFAFRVSKV